MVEMALAFMVGLVLSKLFGLSSFLLACLLDCEIPPAAFSFLA